MTQDALRRVRAAYERMTAVGDRNVWIALRPREEVEAEARELDRRSARGAALPLAGRLLAVKGNIDVAAPPTPTGRPPTRPR
jgi:allophanate hydrolase